MPPQPRRRLHPTPGDPRPRPMTPQPGAVGGAVVGLVSMDRLWTGAPLPRWRADRWDVVEDRCQHGGVIDVGGGDHRGQWQPATLADQVKLGPGLAAIDRICAHLIPRVWRARSWCPRWPATSPAGPVRLKSVGRSSARSRRSACAVWLPAMPIRKPSCFSFPGRGARPGTGRARRSARGSPPGRGEAARRRARTPAESAGRSAGSRRHGR
jgi:hypothetical protein